MVEALTRFVFGAPSLPPKDAARRFAQRFETEYGSTHPRFLEESYKSAIDRAKADAKFLEGIWLGVNPRTDEAIVFGEGRIEQVGTVKRKTEEEAVVDAGRTLAIDWTRETDVEKVRKQAAAV